MSDVKPAMTCRTSSRRLATTIWSSARTMAMPTVRRNLLPWMGFAKTGG